MTPGDDEPTADVPAAVARELEDADERQLRAVLRYARQLRRDHRSLTDAIEAREGEEIVSVDDHGAYANVVVERPDATGEARGPFAYRVQWEPDVDGEGGSFRWHYLGPEAEDRGRR